MDLVFFGSGAFGLPTLAALADKHTIRAVVTQPDRPAGRGGALTPTPIAAWTSKHLPQVPTLKPERVGHAEVIAQINDLAPPSPSTGFVVIAFGQKLPRGLLADRFAINLHASLLPRWRGAAPINAAILAGDRETGNSIITLADRMDAGLVLAQSHREIAPDLTAGDLHDLLASDGPGLVLSVLADHTSGTLRPQPQDDTKVTLAPKLSKSDARIDFSQPAIACRNNIHGLTPWPGVTVHLAAPSLELKLCRAQAAGADPQSHDVGTLVDAAEGLVACGQQTLLRIVEVHPAGKRRMPWSDFILGHRIPDGARLLSRTEAQ